MIEVKELTKIYKSRKSGNCTALDHISFTLPDKGFVFVIGKSGSGKTTLLSLLGGLDTITSGEIIENGRHIDKFGLKEQVYYRNSTIGFIFQDFHLIDELTISENIALALELRGETDKDKIKKALEDTDLAEYENRYPKELSGGQKQRVAIARALVKRPSIILADEPTGNLDSKTTAQILDLLKELSKEKLVVIVSHNLSDAEHYADEIIELSDGKILQHLKRNEDFDARLRVENDTLVIPYGEKLTDENLNTVNSELSNIDIKSVKQDSDRFLPYENTRECESKTESEPLEKKHLKFKHTTKLSVKFARRRLIRTCVYSVIFAAVLVVLGLSQLIMNFNGGEVVAKEMDKRNLSCASFIKDTNDNYDVVDTTCKVDVEAGDLQKFYEAGYEGKAYPLINYALYITSDDSSAYQRKVTYGANPYAIPASVGTLVTEESFLEKKFGSVDYVICAEEQRVDGIYITDFFADACMVNRPTYIKSYSDLLGRYAPYTQNRYAFINGIINTGYKERYKDIIDKVTDPSTSQDELKKIAQSDECLAFYDEICQYLNISYSFNPNFVEDTIKSHVRQFEGLGNSVMEYDGKIYDCSYKYFSCANMNNTVPLADNELVANYSVYNEIFGTTYTAQNMKEFIPHEVKLSYYLACDQNRSQKRYETTLKIVAITDQLNKINVADNVFELLLGIDMFTFGYYFDNAEQEELLFNTASENGFIPNSSIGGSITTMSKAVNVFSRFFNLIFIVLCAALLLLMVQFELKNIRDKMRDIGIMKALGARDIDLIVIFGFQVLIAGLAMIILYIAGSFVFIGLANKVLVLSLNELAKNTLVMDVSFLVVKWKYILQNCVLACIIMAASFLVPMLRLRYIKPTNVIKAKE